MFLQTTMEANVAEFERFAPGDGAAWQRQFEAFMANADVSFGVLGTELWSPAGLGLGQRMLRRFGRRGCSGSPGTPWRRCRDWTTGTFRSDQAHGLLAPLGPPHGLGPENAVSGFMTQVIACAVQLGGMPVPVGGGVQLVERSRASSAMRAASSGPTPRWSRSSSRGGRATEVVLSGGEPVDAARAVVVGVTPTQLYGRLLRAGDVPADVTDAAARRYGRAGCRSTSRWTSLRAGRAPTRSASGERRSST